MSMTQDKNAGFACQPVSGGRMATPLVIIHYAHRTLSRPRSGIQGRGGVVMSEVTSDISLGKHQK